MPSKTVLEVVIHLSEANLLGLVGRDPLFPFTARTPFVAWVAPLIVSGGLLAGDPTEESSAARVSDSPAPTSPLDLTTQVPQRTWKYVVIHHSATQDGSVAGIDAVHRNRRDSQGRPWQGIGYHFVIGNGHGMPDGQLETTFRWREQRDGAHAGNADMNHWGLGICLIGNFEDAPPTPAQLQTLRRLVRGLQQEFRISEKQVLRHGDLKATACPGKLFDMKLLTETQSEIVTVSGEDTPTGPQP